MRARPRAAGTRRRGDCSRSSSPWIGIAVVPLPLLGLIAYEHAYVHAGQSVPLAR